MTDLSDVFKRIYSAFTEGEPEPKEEKSTGEIIYGAEVLPSGPKKQAQPETFPKEAVVDPGKLTDEQLSNIIFNETRSLSGLGIEEARRNIGHAVLNGEELRGKERPVTAPDQVRKVPEVEKETYGKIQQVVQRVREDRKAGFDPTGGAIYFNFRNDENSDPRGGVEHISTQVGPFQNSFPTKDFRKYNIFSNTYFEERR